MERARRVFFIGFDALDGDLVRGWARDGALPTFRELLDTGPSARTRNPTGFVVGAVWPTLATGVGPARHGFYCFRQTKPGAYRETPAPPTTLRAPVFWDRLSEAGKRVAVLDFPRIRLSTRLNGLHLVDWGSHDPVYPEPVSWPESLAKDVISEYGTEPAGPCDVYHRDTASFAAWRDALCERAARKAEIAVDLFHREEWDFAAACFSESHCVGHQAWHLHDATDPRHDAAMRERIGDPIRDVYTAIDAALGRILETLPRDAHVLCLASHGIGGHFGVEYALDEILRRIERAPSTLGARAFQSVNHLWRRLPPTVHKLLLPVQLRFKEDLRGSLIEEDRRRRRFFRVTNSETNSGIRINLKGREAHGLVEPGEEFDELCEFLREELIQVVDADTGRPLIERVHRTNEFHEGPYLDEMPDLFVEWAPLLGIRAIGSPSFRTFDLAFDGNRSGDHRPEGLLMLRSPNGSRLPSVVRGEDVAPTITSLLGVPFPDATGTSVL